MTNIWGFLVQTLTVSLVAALLLAVKELLSDKLSPRWQYGVWSVLALRILLPVSMGRNVLLPVPLWVETWKAMAEKALHSAYADVYTPISIGWPIPMLSSRPRSVTDWLFGVYAAGVVISLLWYLVSYLRLRLVLRRGSPVPEATQTRLQSVCARYALHPCHTVTVSGLPSAFVCGVLRPVLVLPADAETDDKVLLHELLHLKHHDALQSVVWCVLRSLHWCNPFLQFVFNRIGNDMESLCDQRVLEHLEGEERRAYGTILLSMANDRYPRAPGTTSVSNGGKNIARRITAIVRFKKYPKGMGLVSVCVAFVLAFPVLAGTAASYSGDLCRPVASSALSRSLAMTRIQRCTTLAGALDTYAKGLLYENGIYIAMASPLSQQAQLEAAMRYNSEADNWAAYHLDAGDELKYLLQNDYRVYNLALQSDGSYTALLAFSVSAFQNPDGEGLWKNDEGNPYDGSVAVPVTIWQETAWVVEKSGKPMQFLGLSLYQILTPDTEYPWLQYYEKTGKSGTVTLGVQTEYTVSNSVQSSGFNPFGWTTFDETLKPNAVFDRCGESTYVEYRFGGDVQQRNVLSSAAMEIAPLDAPDAQPTFSGLDFESDNGWSDSEDTSWSSNDGTAGCSRPVTSEWDGTLVSGGGDGTDMTKDGLAVLPAGYAVRIYWNGEAVEDFTFGEAN